MTNRNVTLIVMTVSLGVLVCTCPLLAAEQGAIPPGRVITMQNWTRYRAFMPKGMQALFEGKYFWKFPSDVRIPIGSTTHYAMDPAYVANTEKYAQQVRIVDLPNGEHTLKGYVAGRPFPDPSGPRKGLEILIDLWYRYVPYVICSPDVWTAYLKDRYGNVTSESGKICYRRMGHISEQGVPIYLPDAQGIDYSEWVQVVSPEESKYTTNLTLYYLDPTKPEDVYLFIPALRRSLRLSTAARCSPFVGLDLTQDDARTGYNGGIARFDAAFLRDQPIISLVNADPKAMGTIADYYPSVIFPGPRVGKWEVRDTWVIDIRRIPSQRAGYCYGKQIMWVDKASGNGLWKDVYDQNMKLWKIFALFHIASRVPDVGMQYETGNFFQGAYDVQNDHLSATTTADSSGHWNLDNHDCKAAGGIDYYDNVKQYSTVAGLAQIMR